MDKELTSSIFKMDKECTKLCICNTIGQTAALTGRQWFWQLHVLAANVWANGSRALLRATFVFYIL